MLRRLLYVIASLDVINLALTIPVVLWLCVCTEWFTMFACFCLYYFGFVYSSPSSSLFPITLVSVPCVLQFIVVVFLFLSLLLTLSLSCAVCFLFLCQLSLPFLFAGICYFALVRCSFSDFLSDHFASFGFCIQKSELE